MIAIVNVGPHDDPDKLGVRTYEVRINANVVCTFKHRRADGLGMCLLKASKAVERQKWEQASRILDIANVCTHTFSKPRAVWEIVVQCFVVQITVLFQQVRLSIAMRLSESCRPPVLMEEDCRLHAWSSLLLETWFLRV